MSAADRGHRGPRALSVVLTKVTKPALAKRGYVEAALIADWAKIVGPDLAARTRPRRLSFPNKGVRRDGTLTLQVEPAFALDLQHREPQVIERINVYFGYRAVQRLRLQQAPLPVPESPARRRPARPPHDAPPAIAPERLAGIENPDLRAALDRLGRAVAAGPSRPRTTHKSS